MHRRQIHQRIMLALLVLGALFLLIDTARAIHSAAWPRGSGWFGVSVLLFAMAQLRSRRPRGALTSRTLVVVCLVAATAFTVEVGAVVTYGFRDAWVELLGAFGAMVVVYTAVSTQRSAVRHPGTQDETP